MTSPHNHKLLTKVWCRPAALASALLLLLIAMGCDSGGGGGGGDETPPEVFITRPTEAPAYATPKTSITVKGTAVDNQAVDKVTWENHRGGSGTARGSASWEATVALSLGENRITITAIDLAGNTGTDTLAVTYSKAQYTLSGTITAAPNSAVDNDVNDPNASYKNNDTAETAQNIRTPITLGGYANQALTGEEGRSYADGDLNDFFVASLPAGEHIVLNIANSFQNADLDLYLFDHANPLEPIDASVNEISRTESLTVQSAGKYLIQVFAYAGASNYTLTIGQTEPAQSPSGLRLSRDFVSGEAIVELAEPPGIKQANQVEAFSAPGLVRKAGAPGRPGLFAINRAVGSNFSIQSRQPKFPGNALLSAASMTSRTRDKLETLYTIKSLRSHHDVAMAEPNYIRQALQTPNDPKYFLQWHFPLINLPKAWDITTGSSNVSVAVFDTGVLMGHPDLGANISSQSYDFISDRDRALDGDGIDPDASDPGDQSQGGSTFHGTHVAGTIAALTDNNTGGAGVSWNTRIMAIRVLGKNTSGTSYDIMQGLRYAAGLENDSGTTPEEPADIINLSLGGSSFSQSEQNVFTQVRNRGIIIVSAAGNSGENAPSYPASYDGVISVSAVGINARIAPYSNFGSTIDVAAPGGDFSTDLNGDGYADGILSTSGNDAFDPIEHVYTFSQGTSMAAPHMAGVAALMKSLRPGITPDDIDGWLTNGAIVRDLGDAGRDNLYGHGLIDAFKAVRAAQGGGSPTVLDVNPAALNLGTSINAAYLTASRLGEDSLNIISVSDNADWLSINASGTDASGLGTYTVTVTRAGLPDGTYNALITFVSEANTVEIPVNMRIRQNMLGMDPDAGLQYILLVDSTNDETVDQFLAKTAKGTYEYRFSAVAPGSYRIYSGTDLDNDFSVGDAGEASGAYRSTDQPTVLNIDRNRSGLDFVTEFNVDIPGSETKGTVLKPANKEKPILKQVD